MKRFIMLSVSIIYFLTSGLLFGFGALPEFFTVCDVTTDGNYVVTGTFNADYINDIYWSGIWVKKGVTANITLDNFNFAGGESRGLHLEEDATVNLTLKGQNTITPHGTAIALERGSTLIINGSGSLVAIAQNGGAGIGNAVSIGNYENGDIKIILNSGSVTAIGHLGSAGIGSTYLEEGENNNITINGGTITAIAGGYYKRPNNQSAIGRGNNGNTGIVTINGEYDYWTNTTNSAEGAVFGSGVFPYSPEYKYIKLVSKTNPGIEPDTPEISPENGYEIWSETPEKSAAYAEASDGSLDVWVGGGKMKHANGAVTDNKSVQLNLYMYDDGYYNMTKAKTTQWAGRTSGGRVSFENYKLKSDTAAKDIAKISKGKVTAGKKAGSFYAVAYAGVDKKAKTGGLAAEVMINVRESARVIELRTSSSGNETAKPKSVEVKLDDKIAIYPVGYASVKKSVKVAADEKNTYSVSVDPKSKEYIGLSLSSSGAVSDKFKNLTKSDFDKGIWISGLNLKNNKDTKASLVIQNEQSGKKLKLTVNVSKSESEN